MRNKLALHLLSRLDHATSNHRARKRRSEEVHILVDSVSLYGRENELFHKLAAHVVKDKVLGTTLERLFTHGIKVFLLTDIGHVCNHIIALINEPRENRRGVKTTRIGKKNASVTRHDNREGT